MDEFDAKPSEAEFHSMDSGASSSNPVPSSREDEGSPLLPEDTHQDFSGQLDTNLSGQKKVVPDEIDLDDSDSDLSDLSTDSRKFIEPDVGSLNKLLNFDSGDESCDDILDDVGNVTDKLLKALPADNSYLADISDSEVVYQPNTEQLHSSLKEELSSSWSQVSSSLAMANLSLEEVGHIRSVHAKADIEALPDEGSTKKNVKAGRICFQCVKTKFGLFCRSRKCPLCCQSVCSKCVAKISATPSLLLPVADTSSTLPRQRSATTTSPGESSQLSRTGSLRRHSGSLSRNQGSVITVCLDCREMVVQIIRSGETARKMEAARAMMLASLVGREAGRSSGQV